MSVYMTEEEQLEVIKKWWQRNGTWVTVLASCILLAFSLYKYWNWHSEKISTQASNTYEHMMISFSEKDQNSIKAYANQLITEYSRTIYADAARLTLAKEYVSQDEMPKAQKLLEAVVSNSKINAFRQVARLRLARILSAQKAYSQALDELKEVNDATYLPVINELKGDIYAANGQYQEAMVSYKEAINEVRTRGMGNLFLEMKTNELAAMVKAKLADNKIEAA